MKTILELDDLWHPDQIDELIVPIKAKYPNVLVNVFTIPNKFGSVSFLKETYPWIAFCIHGFEHTHFECSKWPSDEAEMFIECALKLGYEPVFKAPNNYMDDETGKACHTLGVTIVHDHTYVPNPEYKAYPGTKPLLRHVRLNAHLVKYPGTQDYIKDHPWFLKEELEEHEFVFIQDFLNEQTDEA